MRLGHLRPEVTNAFITIVLESYITHIRILEDSAYPSTPPPSTADPATKKPRLIIVAVRKSGRVRMHKARENVNGTFSIGKTWTLDDLAAVKSYSGSTPKSLEEEQQKQWAGGTGFVVTIGKPYYWQANTQKEKQFFVASLVKIYTKYTGGKAPELVGFDAREREQLLGLSSRSLPPSQTASPSGPSPAYAQNRTPRRDISEEPPRRRSPSREPVQRPPPQLSPGPVPSYSTQPSRTLVNARRDQSPSSSIDSSGTAGRQNQANLRRIGAMNQSQESFARTEDTASLPPRSRGGMNGLPNAPGRFQDRSMTPNSQRAMTPDSAFSVSRDISDDVPPVPAPLALPPERRRPPMPIIGDARQRNLSDESIIPAPLASPGMRRDDMRIPIRSRDRSRSREPASLGRNGHTDPNNLNTSRQVSEEPTNLIQIQESSTEPPIPPLVSPQNQSVTTSAPVVMPEDPTPEEDLRPGLGPMIKKKKSTMASPVSDALEDDDEAARPGLGSMIKTKKSKADIANTFLKAAKTANSFSTFKPRAGGAAERLREAAAKQQEKSQAGPDGITGVVPAPSLLRNVGSDNTPAVSTPTTATSPRKTNDMLPEVKITVPQSDRPSSIERPVKSQQGNRDAEKPKTKEVKRPKPASELMQKELALLGIDSNILGGRGSDLVAAWDEFGWVGEGVHTKNIDQMKDEIDRELNKIQAGGWLSRLDEEDERIADIHKLIDKTIDECDELDGLLTLYRVELSVSHVSPMNTLYN
jgi:hypothetical protein